MFALVSFSQLVFADKQEAIKFATAIIPPYQTLTDDGVVTGSAINIVECAMKELNRAHSINVLPWVRAQKLVEQGEFAAFFVASQNEARNKYATLSTPLFDSSWVWFLPKTSTLDPSSQAFIDQASVGGVFGTNMYSWLKKDFEHVVIKTGADELFRLLSVDRLDAVLLTKPMFIDSVKRLGLQESNFRSVVAKERPLGVYFSNDFLAKNPEILSRFNHSVKTCR